MPHGHDSENPSIEDASSPAVTNLPLCWTAIDEAHDDRRVPDLFHRAQPAHDFRKNRIGGSQLPAWTLDADAQPRLRYLPLTVAPAYEVRDMESAERRRRIAIAEASDKLWNGEITRSAFLQICARAGIGLAGLATLSSPRRATAGPPTVQEIRATAGPSSAIEPSSDQHRFLRDAGRSFSGQTVRVVTEDTPPSLATREIMKHEFIPLTGINVVWELLPLDRVLAKVSADTARRAGTNDIFYLDQAWVGRFANDTVPVQKLLARKDLVYPGYDFDDILPALVRHIASYDGQVVGIPYDIPIHILLYRRDILDRLRLPLPKTVPEYLVTVQAIQREMQPHVYGTTGMWKSGHYSLLIDAATWLWAYGGSFFGLDNRPAINDDRAVAAMEFMRTLAKYAPPEAITWDWNGATKSFVEGRAGMYINAGEWFSVFDDPAQSKVVGLVEAAPCPAERALRWTGGGLDEPDDLRLRRVIEDRKPLPRVDIHARAAFYEALRRAVPVPGDGLRWGVFCERPHELHRRHGAVIVDGGPIAGTEEGATIRPQPRRSIDEQGVVA